MFYLLACRVCARDQRPGSEVIPFGSAAERGKWAAAHTRGTGHDSWLVMDKPEPGGDLGPPDPGVDPRPAM